MLLHFTVPGHEGPRNSESVQTERFEDDTMENQSNNVNFWDDMEKWLETHTHDEPLGDLATNSGDYGSTEKPRDACQPKSETDSECMAIRIVDEIGLLGDCWRHTLTAT